MPVSNFHRVLKVTDRGRRLAASGPLPLPDYDIKEIRVFAVVTQQPGPCKPEPGDDTTPLAVTCHGEATRSGDALRAAAAAERTWDFDERTAFGEFREGWARGTAIALEFQDDGDFETYSWSAWVWLEIAPDDDP
jgi:hypothetical protein